MAERWEYRNRDDARGYDYDHGRRGPMERAGDEVRSWFGDDEAARRRRLDETREGHDRDWNDRGRNSAERAWDRTRDTARDATDRDRDGRRGLSEWNDNDRPRAFGDTSRYASADQYSPADRQYYTPAERGAASARRDWDSPDYTGMGPRGYRRSDARMFEDICDRLTVDPRVDASDVEVVVKDGDVTLNGSVRSREEKRYAEDLVEHVMGVHDVSNHLKVSREVIGSARSGANAQLGLTDTPPPQTAAKR
jgi:osmotically-inducible protein OsmY